MEDPKQYYALPPRGLTVGTARIGVDIRHHYTFFCPDNDDCYAVAYGTSEDSARRQLANHLCPAVPRRDMHPSGRPAIQKAWDELDEVIRKIKDGPTSREDELRLQGEARGLAMAIAFFAPPYFRNRDDVLRQANKRWRMGKGEIPWESTPGYQVYPVSPSDYIRREDVSPPAKTRVATGGKLQTKKVTPKASPPITRNFTMEELRLIRETVASGNMPIEDVASMWAVTVDRIKVICTPVDESVTNVGLPMAMF